jgi:hypothetical protein
VTNLYVQGWEFGVVALGFAASYYFLLKRKWLGVTAGLLLAVVIRFPLPHSTPFVLKLSGYPWGLMLTRGLWFELADLLRRGFPVFLLAVLGCWHFRKWWPLVAFGVAFTFSVAVGGDAWSMAMESSRWVLCVVPLLIPPAVAMLVELLDRDKLRTPLVLALATAALCLTWTVPTKILLVEQPHNYRPITKQRVAMTLAIRDRCSIGAGIALVGAGLTPWLAPGRVVNGKMVPFRYYDLLGFNDMRIARLPAHRAPKGKNPLTYFLPGHLKFSPDLTVKWYHPDVILDVWAGNDFPDDWKVVDQQYQSLDVDYAGYTSTIFIAKSHVGK